LDATDTADLSRVLVSAKKFSRPPPSKSTALASLANDYQRDSAVPGNRISETQENELLKAINEGRRRPDSPINDPYSTLVKKTQAILDEALDLCRVSQDLWKKGEPQKAIETLDNALILTLGMNTTDQPNLRQQKEDLRFKISRRILEIDASHNIVVNGNHKAIPLVINNHVQAEIDLLIGGRIKDFFRAGASSSFNADTAATDTAGHHRRP